MDATTCREQAKREQYAPWVGVFRWWARRPSSVVGALLDAGKCVFGSRYVVADIFSGGGTVGFEAAARGLPVYAQDLYPWPAMGLATGLGPIRPEAFRRAADELLEALKPYRRAYACGPSELSHVLRVRTADCAACDYPVHLFRRNLVSMRSRSPNERQGFMGCIGCGKLSLRAEPVQRFSCDHCGLKSRPEPPSVRGRPQFRCPHCRHVCPLAELLARPGRWTPVLVQEVIPGPTRKPKVVIRPPRDADPVQDHSVRPRLRHVAGVIPHGLETDCLHRDGYRRWSDLFTNRQLRILKEALRITEDIQCPDSVRNRLRLAVLGACEMAAYVSRWEAHYPKAIEAIANHRYARITVSAETNLLSEIGRGTLPRRLAAAERAAVWWSKTGARTKVRISDAHAKRRPHIDGVLVAIGSSTRQLLADGQVDLLITDPPYHDDVQYGELARLFHAWLAAAGGTFAARESDEVVPNRQRERGTDWYRDSVTACLKEGCRTLAEKGRLILTYHNNDLTAWLALGQAISQAGFRVVAIATAATENPADHSKRGRTVFLHDLVIECQAAHDVARRPPVRVGRCDTDERRNLLAIGLTISNPGNCRNTERFRRRFEGHLNRLGAKTVLIS